MPKMKLRSHKASAKQEASAVSEDASIGAQVADRLWQATAFKCEEIFVHIARRIFQPFPASTGGVENFGLAQTKLMVQEFVWMLELNIVLSELLGRKVPQIKRNNGICIAMDCSRKNMTVIDIRKI